MFVELHMIQNFGPSCLNRDDTNTPKDCFFGGFRRARISSQCLKSAIRDYFNSQLDEFSGKMGVRTRLLPKTLIDMLVEKGKKEDQVTNIVKNVLAVLLLNKKDQKKVKKIESLFDNKEKKMDILIFINRNTPKRITDIIIDNWDDFNSEKITSEMRKTLEPLIDEIKSTFDPDIALFGRMVASKADLNVDAACYMAHALSTHKVDMEMDFYTAIDDLQEQEESGAGMMGIIMYNSSCFYRYSVLSVDQLVKNLQDDSDYAVSVIKAFIEASINAIPTGKQTSMAAFNKPDFIMITTRTDQPWSLVNAFASPTIISMKNTDLINQSIIQLEGYLKDMLELYGTPSNLNLNYSITGDRPIDYLNTIGQQKKTIKELIESVGEAISERYSAAS